MAKDKTNEPLFDPSRLNIIPVDLDNEMKKSYIDYSMSVIVSRALPDVRDGLKPVHRRILYAMYEDGITPDKPYKKCATTVGNVLGRYHPHGDSSVYDALVRMAQDFSMRYPTVDGHGNFGSIDGDGAAAYRYTEARMSKLSLNMLTDIGKDTVDFMPNFDESKEEPVVLPSRFPHLLVNGSDGIAVGMATKIPPHNLGEVIDGVIALIDNPDITVDELMEYIPGPDFPTGGQIMGTSGIRAAYSTGRGKLKVRAKAEIEPWKEGRERIVVTEIPYMVNKARLIEKIADLVHEKRVEGISDLRDESDRDGLRIVIELKRDANSQIVLNQLYKYTQLEDTFGVIMLALVDRISPKVLSLKEVLRHYIDFQKDVIVRRTKFDKKKAEARAHILEGLQIALNNIDEVINIIRNSYNDAKQRLIERFAFSDEQAQAILDMRLGRLAGMEREKVDNELNELHELIAHLGEILESEQMVLDIIKEEITEIKNKFSDPRRTSIEPVADDIDIEDLIAEEDNVITMTHQGYIKRLPVDTYRSQHRGGKGIVGMQTKEEDFVSTMFISSTHSYVMFFTNTGRMFRIKAYRIPEAGRQAKGTPIINLLDMMPGESISAVIPIKEYSQGQYLTMCTRHGIIKKTDIMEYQNAPKGGKIAIKLDDGDELLRVKLTNGNTDLFFGTHNGKMIRFNEKDARELGRVSRGMRAIKLEDDDYVVGMSIYRENCKMLVVSENGYGKKTDLGEYKIQARGGKGCSTYKITPETGKIAGIKVVSPDDDIILITSDGIIIRLDTEDISTYSRVTKGVKLMRLGDGVKITTIARVEKEHDE
ncbi:MAG TPA: DNA gyrase subunit A [Candidatus Monoglobus merdigallinarum]|uniref:DNA gyrase subunit A n=1 Tax=Candidatus Monoglobus merdigallinarum TaxID=2838698 RepID=A0A9D1TM25_9FIRM|nr:DNA gyrase subunit A [Candidatus Monoglobus merdigallinarum]